MSWNVSLPPLLLLLETEEGGVDKGTAEAVMLCPDLMVSTVSAKADQNSFLVQGRTLLASCTMKITQISYAKYNFKGLGY